MTTLLVDLAALATIGLIVWWFWLARPAAQRAGSGEVIEIVVADGVYTPSRIAVKPGRATKLRFLRKDPSPCAEKVIFADLDIAVDLPVGTAIEVRLPPQKAGEYAFTCQMQMYRGTLVVQDS